MVDRVTARVIDTRRASDHFEYLIELTRGPRTWTVWRRYKEFDTCYKALKKMKAAVSALPPKTLSLHAKSPRTGEKRSSGLELWLNEHLASPSAMMQTPLQALIGVLGLSTFYDLTPEEEDNPSTSATALPTPSATAAASVLSARPASPAISRAICRKPPSTRYPPTVELASPGASESPAPTTL